MKQTFTYRSEIQEIPSIREDLLRVQTEWSIPDSEMRQIGVMIEEIFSNIIRFAYKDSLDHQVHISLSKINAEVILQITDDGIPFNPLEHHPGPVSDPAVSVDSGMGLTLIKTFSNSLSYQRVNHHNQLSITKKIKSQNGEAGE